MNINLLLLGCCLLFSSLSAVAESVASPGPCAVVTNLPYYSGLELQGAGEYQRSQCRLDIRYPTNRTDFATLVWFHGGGLTQGSRHFPELKDPRVAVVAVGYRLSPKAELPSFIEDAAASTAWVIANIAQYGGNSNKVFVAGHSAGGYLTAMIGMDPKWLAARGVSNLQLAGLIPVSGQMTTHFHVKKLRGDKEPELRPIIDEYAPMYYCASNLPPICLILGDRTIEYKNRVEENALMAVSLKNLGHPNVEFYEMGGLDHGTVGEGGMILLRQFIQKFSNPSPVPAPKKATARPPRRKPAP
jgi:acetyl esterase/lipase